jgi:prepilin-type N-terminal cleavage/methylation domain-containing protein
MFVKRKKENQEGFTLLELLVVIALMGIITGITLSNYSGMNKSVELQNTVYNVALSIRESQVYGINKKLDSAEFSDEDPYPFGMHIDTANIDKIIIFKDRDGNPNNQFLGASDCSITTPKECEKIIKLNKGNHISKIRVKSLGGG